MSAYFYKQVFFISIHAPREGGDSGYRRVRRKSEAFQSTPPARGATSVSASLVSSMQFQSTPPARGATDGGGLPPRVRKFQSTPPARGATPRELDALVSRWGISIHAPREGGDCARDETGKILR